MKCPRCGSKDLNDQKDGSFMCLGISVRGPCNHVFLLDPEQAAKILKAGGDVPNRGAHKNAAFAAMYGCTNARIPVVEAEDKTVYPNYIADKRVYNTDGSISLANKTLKLNEDYGHLSNRDGDLFVDGKRVFRKDSYPTDKGIWYYGATRRVQACGKCHSTELTPDVDSAFVRCPCERIFRRLIVGDPVQFNHNGDLVYANRGEIDGTLVEGGRMRPAGQQFGNESYWTEAHSGECYECQCGADYAVFGKENRLYCADHFNTDGALHFVDLDLDCYSNCQVCNDQGFHVYTATNEIYCDAHAPHTQNITILQTDAIGISYFMLQTGVCIFDSEVLTFNGDDYKHLKGKLYKNGDLISAEQFEYATGKFTLKASTISNRKDLVAELLGSMVVTKCFYDFSLDVYRYIALSRCFSPESVDYYIYLDGEQLIVTDVGGDYERL